MVFHCKQNVCASASHLLLPFVSFELGNKTAISYLSAQQSKLYGFEELFPMSFFIVSQPRDTVAQSGDALNTDDIKHIT